MIMQMVLYYCTYLNTGRNQYPKHHYNVNCVVCSLCAQLCHYKHELVYAGCPNDMSRVIDKDLNLNNNMNNKKDNNNYIYQCDKCKCNVKALSIDNIRKELGLMKNELLCKNDLK